MFTFAAMICAFAAIAQCNPQFNWTAAPTTVAPYQVSFTNTSTFPGSAPQYVNSSRIYFGDNTMAYGFNGSLNHNYPGPGTYNAKLVIQSMDSVTNNWACQDTLIQQVVVGNTPCYSTFTTSSLGNGQYTFTANTPSGPAGVNYSWNFGDGTPAATGSPVSHTYASNGFHMVTLTATDSGCIHIATDSLFVNTLPISMCDTLEANIYSTSAGSLSRNFYNYSTWVSGLSNNAQWYFGDGGSSTLNNPTHTYPAAGTYYVTLVNTWKDSFNVVVCTDSVSQPITLYPASNICDSLSAYMAITNAGPLSINLQNVSNTIVGLTNNAHWLFGDGGSSTSNYTSHTYASAGTYNIVLINSWKDSSTNAVVCTDTMVYPYTLIGVPNNEISGYIVWDSLPVLAYDSFKVWLIKFDSVTNTLSAVDSTLTSGASYFAPYSFGAQPAGSYRIKAASLLSVPGTTGLVPTYHQSSLYWNTATVVNHTGGLSNNKYIWMQLGSVPTGPGFVAGNVSLGAGKGTNTGVPNLLVFLRNSNNELISSAYTDANGDFKFEHIPTGAYTVYPEQINYATTAAPVIIDNGQLSKTGIDFEQTETEILPKNVTRLNDLATAQDIKVYPNPFRDQIIIDNRAGNYSQVSFITVTGQTVYKQNIKQGNNHVATSGLAPGVYFLLINGKEKTGRMTITKQ